MSLITGRTLRTALCISGIFLLTGCGLTSCSGGDDNLPGFTQTVKGENGSESSVRFGKDAVIPADFPSGVPLPTAGPLRAVVAEKNPPNASYTMTYAMGGRDGNVLGNQYRQKLENAGFKIEHYSSVGGTDNQITQFDAVGKKWDVAVVSGKASPRDRSTFSVQVHTHGQITSGIGGIGDTTPDITAPQGSGIEIPDANPGGSSTTTTTSGF
jgi:hypothetical protein